MAQAALSPSTKIVLALPFVKDANYWRVPIATDFQMDCRVGRMMGARAIDVIRETNSPFILGWIARDQGRIEKLDGFAVGFWQQIAEQIR